MIGSDYCFPAISKELASVAKCLMLCNFVFKILKACNCFVASFEIGNFSFTKRKQERESNLGSKYSTNFFFFASELIK